VLCLRNGKPGVVEYSEIAEDQATAVDPGTGLLKYNSSHICINLFTVDFLQRIAASHTHQLPYHIAKKKIPYANDDGKTVAPADVNGWKLEMFIFDSFEFATNLVGLEVPREDEFSPLKNGPSAAMDSPSTCRRSLSNYHRRLIKRAGGAIDASGDALVEISPLVSYSGEDLAAQVSGKTYDHFPVLLQ